jgi:hypothetical protein
MSITSKIKAFFESDFEVIHTTNDIIFLQAARKSRLLYSIRNYKKQKNLKNFKRQMHLNEIRNYKKTNIIDEFINNTIITIKETESFITDTVYNFITGITIV